MDETFSKAKISEYDWFDCKGTVNPAGVEELAWDVEMEGEPREEEEKPKFVPDDVNQVSIYLLRFPICL